MMDELDHMIAMGKIKTFCESITKDNVWDTYDFAQEIVAFIEGRYSVVD